jgi:hypothetical protein
MSTGKENTERARRIFDAYHEIDPLAPLGWAQSTWRFLLTGRHSEAVAATRRILELAEVGNPTRVYAGYYLMVLNVPDEAAHIFEQEGVALGATPYGAIARFFTCALKRDGERAISNITPGLEQAAFWTEYLALFLADGYAVLGQRDPALHWLRKAMTRGFINYPYIAQADSLLNSLRGDTEFEQLLEEVKRRWHAMEF